MEQELLNSLDSWEIISLFVSFLVVSIAIYRWLMIRWQADVNLKKYVFVHGIPGRRLDGPFDIELEVPEDQQVVLAISQDGNVLKTIHNGPMTKGKHVVGVDCRGMTAGKYALAISTDGQEDIKLFEWSGS